MTVTFEDYQNQNVIDGATFTAADVTITGPAGNVVALSGDPVDSGDGLTFTLNFATPQALAGQYNVTIGPDVLDTAGNPMNQDGDPINGETNGQDDYNDTFQIGPPVARSFPFVEDFEVGDIGAL